MNERLKELATLGRQIRDKVERRGFTLLHWGVTPDLDGGPDRVTIYLRPVPEEVVKTQDQRDVDAAFRDIANADRQRELRKRREEERANLPSLIRDLGLDL